MWSPVLFVLLVASARADAAADADADAEPFLPYMYPQYDFGNSWAALHFGSPQETLQTKLTTNTEGDAAHRPSFGFLPGVVAPSPLLAIRDVQAPSASIQQLKKPTESHDVQLLRRPSLIFAPPLFLQTSHIRVPDHNQKVPLPVPVATAPSSPAFASQHTAQVPLIVHPAPYPSIFDTVRLNVPFAAPSFAIQHSAQVPIFSHAFTKANEDDDDEDEDETQVNVFLVPHFPTEIASLTSLRDMGSEPVIPAGIVQSTQPSFRPMQFKNSKVHPDLLSKVHDTSSSGVVSV